MWQRALALLPEDGIESYTQGLMDLGATLCTRSSSACGRCPLQTRCVAFAEGRTTELPTRKPKKQSKEKRAVMLLLLDQNRVLLERRPDSGIWGGLLSLPEVDGMQPYMQAEADEPGDASAFKVITPGLLALTARFGEVEIRRELPVIEHVFTHFKLHIHTVLAELTQHAPQVAESNYVWLDLQQAAEAGVPAPIKTLLNSLAQAELQL